MLMNPLAKERIRSAMQLFKKDGQINPTTPVKERCLLARCVVDCFRSSADERIGKDRLARLKGNVKERGILDAVILHNPRILRENALVGDLALKLVRVKKALTDELTRVYTSVGSLRSCRAVNSADGLKKVS